MKKQRGVALIIVLMIVALVSVLATEMGARLQLQMARASSIKDSNQAYWYAIGAEEFARKSIAKLIKKDASVLTLEDGWSEEFTFPVEGGGIQAQLTDMQTCFNLNAVRTDKKSPLASKNDSANKTNKPNTNKSNSSTNTQTKTKQPQSKPELGKKPDEAEAFQRLLENAIPELDAYTKDVVTDSLMDWLDDDDKISRDGAEDPDYSSLINPYLAANNLMASKSEIRLVNGVDPNWIMKLLPHICVIPNLDRVQININTLTEEQAPLLAALTGLNVDDAQSLISSRPMAGFKNKQSFISDPVFGTEPLSNAKHEWFTLNTDYFLLRTKTRYNNASFAMTSLLKVDKDDKITVIRREFGGVL